MYMMGESWPFYVYNEVGMSLQIWGERGLYSFETGYYVS